MPAIENHISHPGGYNPEVAGNRSRVWADAFAYWIRQFEKGRMAANGYDGLISPAEYATEAVKAFDNALHPIITINGEILTEAGKA